METVCQIELQTLLKLKILDLSFKALKINLPKTRKSTNFNFN